MKRALLVRGEHFSTGAEAPTPASYDLGTYGDAGGPAVVTVKKIRCARCHVRSSQRERSPFHGTEIQQIQIQVG